MNNKLYAVAGTALFATAAHATLLSGFETGVEGWSASGNASVASSTTGATEGSKSLAITYTGFNWIESAGAASQANATALNASTTKKLAFDVTVGSGGLGNWANVLLSFNDAGNWRQTANSVALPTVAGAKATVTIDYSSLLAPNYAGGNWFQYYIGVNADHGTTIYIDNVRTVEAVPEPASMAALGLGAVAFARKRRNRR